LYDVIVIGGGPAGSVISYILANKGFNVLLLEKYGRNRYKPCAGGVSTVSMTTLEKLKLRIPEEVIEAEIYYARIIHKTKELTLTTGKLGGYCVYRSKFDQWLRDSAESAGVEVKHECPAYEVKIHKDCVEVKHRGGMSEGKILVGAFGALGILQFYKQLGIKEKPKFSLAVQREFILPDEDMETIADTLELYFGSDITTKGYFWIFPKTKSNGASVGLIEDIPEPRMTERLDKIISKHPVASKRLVRAKPISISGVHLSGQIVACSPINKPYGDRFILIGEAAGLVEGFAWEGMSTAIRSAVIGAEVLTKALEKDKFDEMTLKEYYDKLKKELINHDLIYQNKLGQVLYSCSPKEFDTIINGLIKLLQIDKEVGLKFAEVLGRLVTGEEIIKLLLSKKLAAIKAFGLIQAIKLFFKFRKII